MNSPQQSPSGARKSVLFNQRDHSYSRSSPTLSSSSRSFKKRSTLSRFSSFFKPERESKSRSPTFSILVPLPSVIIERVTQLKSINSVDKKKLTQQTKTFDETSTENDGNGICLEIISSLEKEDIFLFDDIENITSIMNHSKQQQITFARVLCNEMEQSHFLLLQTITTYLCMHNNSSIQESFIQRLAYVTSEVLIPQLNEFFTVIKSNIDQIFEVCFELIIIITL